MSEGERKKERKGKTMKIKLSGTKFLYSLKVKKKKRCVERKTLRKNKTRIREKSENTVVKFSFFISKTKWKKAFIYKIYIYL